MDESGSHLVIQIMQSYEQRMMTLLQRRYGSVHLIQTADPCGFSSRVRDYLAGDYRCLDDIPVKTGGTPFQQQVWSALRTIPAGTTTTYGDLAALLGKPAAYRAVGAANALNPVAIVLPCHRVVGADASLTGYAGGLERKHSSLFSVSPPAQTSSANWVCGRRVLDRGDRRRWYEEQS